MSFLREMSRVIVWGGWEGMMHLYRQMELRRGGGGRDGFWRLLISKNPERPSVDLFGHLL